MTNKGIIIDAGRGRIRLSRDVDDTLGNPDYVDFIADDFVLTMVAGDNDGKRKDRINRNKSVEIYCKAVTDWIIRLYGLDCSEKYNFDALDLHCMGSISYVNIDIGYCLSENIEEELI